LYKKKIIIKIQTEESPVTEKIVDTEKDDYKKVKETIK